MLQVTKYVEREIINHRQLVHPHIIQFKEVRRWCTCHPVSDSLCRTAWPETPKLSLPLECAVVRLLMLFHSAGWLSTCTPAVCLQVFLTQQHLSIAMEYAAGGDMFEYVVRKGGLRESEARWFFQQLIVAVDYIHRMVRALAPKLGSHSGGERGEGCRGFGSLMQVPNNLWGCLCAAGSLQLPVWQLNKHAALPL